MNKKKVVLGFLGTTLDKGATEARWNRWRPTLSLFGHEDDFQVDRLELFLSNENAIPLAQHISDDVGEKSPGTEVFAHNLDTPDPWDFPDCAGSTVDERPHAASQTVAATLARRCGTSTVTSTATHLRCSSSLAHRLAQ